MFVILPWKVDVPQDRLPFANWLVIAIIFAFFFWQLNQVNTYHTTIEDELHFIAAKAANGPFQLKTDLFNGFVLQNWNIRGMLGHMWLHAGWMHILGNVFFLWVFGNSVCAKVGQIKFIILYLIFGIAAGACQLYLKPGPSLGASGAIYGVMGMYLVFFPTNSVSSLFVMIFPYYVRVFEMSGLFIMILRIAFDVIGAILGGGTTAHFAHIGGFVTGFLIASLMLLIGIEKMSRDEISIYKMLNPGPGEDFSKPLYHQRILRGDYENQTCENTIPPSGDFIHIICQCGTKCKVPSQFVGKTGKCPNCKKTVKITLPN